MARKKKEEVASEVTEVKESQVDFKKIKKDIDKYLNEKQEEFSKSITEQVENQIEVSVTKRMKEEEKKFIRGKNGKIIRRDIFIVLLLCGIGYFGYCLYDVDYFHIRNKLVDKVGIDDKDNKEPEEPKFDSSYYIEKYRYLVDSMQIDDASHGELYSMNYTKFSLPNALKLKIVYKNLSADKKDMSGEMMTVSSMNMLDSAKEFFGDDVVLSHEMFSYGSTKFMFYNDVYLGIAGEDSRSNLVYKIYEAREENDLLIFEVAVGKVVDNRLMNIRDEVILEEYSGADLMMFKDALSKYKYTFIKNNNGYVFSSIEGI